MKQKDLCQGSQKTVWMSAGKYSISEWEALWTTMRPSIKRPKTVCPICKRKVRTSVQYCHDGDCIGFTVPPHKPKHWWKKKNR